MWPQDKEHEIKKGHKLTLWREYVVLFAAFIVGYGAVKKSICKQKTRRWFKAKNKVTIENIFVTSHFNEKYS